MALCAVTALGLMTSPLLLVLVFANGIGLALRWPVFSAIVPELVPREQLASALALNGVAMNLSRIVGPLLAGALIASAGSVWVFALNAVLSMLSGFLILRWRHEHRPSPLGQERLLSAMRVGVQFVRQSPRLRAVLLRVSIFFLHSTALLALLPLLARGLAGGDAGTFTLLLACMGAGAIIAVLALPRLRQTFGRDGLVVGGTAVQSAATAVMAVAPSAWVAVPAMICRRHGLDHRRELARGVGADVAAQLGARARHGELPDGDHGLERARRRALGTGGDARHDADGAVLGGGERDPADAARRALRQRQRRGRRRHVAGAGRLGRAAVGNAAGERPRRHHRRVPRRPASAPTRSSTSCSRPGARA